MPFEIFFEYPNNDFGRGILLENYNGKFSLYAARKPTQGDGTIYKEWVYFQTKDAAGKKQPSEKQIPLKVVLGNQHEAIAMLRQFLKHLTNQQDDIPY